MTTDADLVRNEAIRKQLALVERTLARSKAASEALKKTYIDFPWLAPQPQKATQSPDKEH